MFEAGKVYKVKVEAAPGEVGFGRATILDKSGNQICIQLRTSKDANKILPKGTRIWFVSDAPDISFNGMWSSNVIGTQMMSGKSVMICGTPKLEPLLQRRRTPRVALDVPVKLWTEGDEDLNCDTRSKDISRSGIALETAKSVPLEVNPGNHIKIVVESTVGDIKGTARVIRVDRNWLANKNIVGLEFTELTEEAVALLDKLLVLLGGRPRNEESETEVVTGLSGQLGGQKEGSSKFLGGARESKTEDSDAGSDA